MNNFYKTMKMFIKWNKMVTICFVVCSLIEVPILILELLFTKRFVESLQININILDNSLVLDQLFKLILVVFSSGIISSCRALCQTHLEEISLLKKDEIILSKTLKLSINKLDSPEIKSMRENASRLELHVLLEEWVFFICDVIKIICLVSIILWYEMYLVVTIVFCFSILQLFVRKNIATKIENIQRQQVSSIRYVKYLFSLLIGKENVQEIRLLKCKNYLVNKMTQVTIDYQNKIQSKIIKSEIMNSYLQLFSLIVNIIVIIVLALSIIGGHSTAGLFILLYQIITSLFGLNVSFSSHFYNATQCNIKYSDFNKYIQLDEIEFEEKQLLNETSLEIDLKNTCFMYPDSQIKAVDNINLNIRPGEKIALVGENGSGKSTIVKLIMGLYKPNEGTIKWFENKEELDQKYIFGYIRVVFQDFSKLLRTIRENVGMGDKRKIANNIQIEKAL